MLQIWRIDDDTDGSITSIQSIDDSYLPKNRCDMLFDRYRNSDMYRKMISFTIPSEFTNYLTNYINSPSKIVETISINHGII